MVYIFSEPSEPIFTLCISGVKSFYVFRSSAMLRVTLNLQSLLNYYQRSADSCTMNHFFRVYRSHRP